MRVIARPSIVPRAALPPPPDLGRRLARSPLLVAVDIDGTLAPIAPTPEAASVPPETRRILTTLAARPGVSLAFVTGRAASDGARLAGIPTSWIIGNHGMECIDPAGAVRVNPRVEPYAAKIAEAHEQLGALPGEVPGVILENKRWTLSVHYRLAARDNVPQVEAAVREIATQLSLRMTLAKEIYELRPPVAINKGTAIIELANLLGVFEGRSLRGSVLYAGDDSTDEDAFRLLRERSAESVTVHVGHGQYGTDTATAAEYLVPDPPALRELLEWLLSVR